MLDKDTQIKLLKLAEAKKSMDRFVLACMRDEELTLIEIDKLRKEYTKFCAEMDKIETKFTKTVQGTPEEWIGMWKGQTND